MQTLRHLAFCILVGLLVLPMFTTPFSAFVARVEALGNGGSLCTDYRNYPGTNPPNPSAQSGPMYGTQDWVAEHALYFLSSAERRSLFGRDLVDVPALRQLYLCSTDFPDRTGTEDMKWSKVWYRANGTLQEPGSASKAQIYYQDLVNTLHSFPRNYTRAAMDAGIMAHYIAQVASFPHVMGRATDWGAEPTGQHNTYDRMVGTMTNKYDDLFNQYLHDDGPQQRTGASATLLLARDTTFDLSGNGLSAVWMNQNFDWNNQQFRDRSGFLVNEAVNMVTDALRSAIQGYQELFDNDPQIQPVPAMIVREHETATFTVSASDPDPEDVVSYHLGKDAPQGAVINVHTGVFTWSSGEVFADKLFAFSAFVSDGNRTANERVFIRVTEVDDPPYMDAPTPVVVREGNATDMLLKPVDPDSPPASIGATALSIPDEASYDNSTGRFQWTPSEEDGPGNVTATFRMTEGSQTWDVPVTFKVQEVNRAPSISAPFHSTVRQGETLNLPITATDPDVPSNAITLSVTGLPEGANFDNRTGTFRWTPGGGTRLGDYNVTFTATDNGTPQLSSSKAVLITVTSGSFLLSMGVFPLALVGGAVAVALVLVSKRGKGFGSFRRQRPKTG